ncbi:MAG: acyl-CoA/acyl-ACP dehydrogenase [Magnetospirillum sp.]|nr:acyl-CoA/acyl-ACP dehydrogenase [Magnetospirillum sp.]
MNADSPAAFLADARRAAAAADALLADAKLALAANAGEPADLRQRATHGFAWFATYAEAIRAIAAHVEDLAHAGALDGFEIDLAGVALGEYLAQMAGGIAMSPGEIVRPTDLGLDPAAVAARLDAPLLAFAAARNAPGPRARLAAALAEGREPAEGEDADLAAMRRTMRDFAARELAEQGHRWHLDDAYIPMAVVDRLAELGVFGLTVPEAYGGAGLGKAAMCAVSDELSRGYLGAGSLGTRAEIAAELILGSGTEAQKSRFLPGLASGAILPTAVFTEPDIGSDLASLRTRAVREGDVYRVYGAKTWITHAARADLMTLLVRTDPAARGHEGLSMLLAEKPRGTDADPFPVAGLRGTEIGTLGYRGMKEYELAFDGFAVKAENLLGGVEGQGFRQLMRTFESARIQTAARAVGVARAALDASVAYARTRVQFGKPILGFARVADKIAMMAAEILAARLLARHAARRKDAGGRCDLEAGMSKLLAARVAWACADNAVQIHGGNGYALEYPVSRLLVDARILAIFEGAAEIQAEVIARRLMAGAN